MYSATITATKKGSRVWIQGTGNKQSQWHGGARYNIAYTPDAIVLTLAPEGKRGVTNSKGGLVDLESKKITLWAMGASMATITITPTTMTFARI